MPGGRGGGMGGGGEDEMATEGGRATYGYYWRRA